MQGRYQCEGSGVCGVRNAPCKRERSKKLVTKRGKTAAGGRRDNLHKPQLEQADWTRLQSSWAGEHKHSQVLLEGSFNSAKGIDLSGRDGTSGLSKQDLPSLDEV